VYLRVRLSVRQTKQDFYEHRGKLTACIIVVICEKLWHTPLLCIFHYFCWLANFIASRAQLCLWLLV